MTLKEIWGYTPINDTKVDRVEELVTSMITDGWQGAPILVDSGTGSLITGSHRLAALMVIKDRYKCGEYEDIEDGIETLLGTDVAEDISDLVDDRDNPWENLGSYLTGTRIEKYKNQIYEWE